MKGSHIPIDTGYYGIKGIANSLNEPPYRYEPAFWTDLDGNFWLFGGQIDDTVQFLNDLWKYDVSKNEWTWVSGARFHKDPYGKFGTKGVSSNNIYPSARGYGAACWRDLNGNLWLYGGSGYNKKGATWDAGLCDLWRYDVSTNEWTWVNGNDSAGPLTHNPDYGIMTVSASTNDPGGMPECRSSWVDKDDNFWLFGGTDGTNYFDDIWKYDPSINQWTWMKGSKTYNGIGSYGKIGVENSSNLPPALISSNPWKDEKGNCYFFAGIGKSVYNNVWKYNPITNNWTCLIDDTIFFDTGRYIAKCVMDTFNHPPVMWDNQTVQTGGCSDLFWSFGGGLGSSAASINNDLWLLNVKTLQWTLVSGGSGENIKDTVTYYGKQGVLSPLNKIPGEVGFAIWTDIYNNIWIFDGNGRNTLWKFIPDTSCFHPAITTKKLHINDTVIGCKDTAYINLKGLEIYISSIIPTGNILVQQDTSITFTPEDTTHYIITYYQIECSGFDTLHYTVNVKPCPVPPPVLSYIQTYITTAGYWNIVNKPSPLSVTIYDALGQVLYQDNNYQNTLDTRKWSAGVYLYSVTDGSGIKNVGKMVVVR